MQTTKGTLIGQRGLRLAYASFLPDAQPSAVAVLVHGYGEHMGRYSYVIEALIRRGYAVYTIDHRGHGGSEGVRAHVEHFDYFVDDLHLLARLATTDQPGLPVVMIGHSMGGLIATRYALVRQHELDALVVSGAALQIGDDVSSIVKRIGALLATLLPSLPVAPASKEGLAVLSRDQAVQDAFQNDPLCYKGRLRARMGNEMLKAAVDARAHCGQITLPLLVMHGAEDKLTNPRGSQLLYEQAGSPDKTLKLWPGCRHEIFNEPEKDEVIAFMLDWIDGHVRPRQAHGIDAAPDTSQPIRS